MTEIRIPSPHFAQWLLYGQASLRFHAPYEWMRDQCFHACRTRITTYRGLKGHLVNVHGHDETVPTDHEWRAAFRQYAEDVNAGVAVRVVRGRTAIPFDTTSVSWRLPTEIADALKQASKETGIKQREIIACALVFYLGIDLQQPIDQSMCKIPESRKVEVDL